MPGRSHSRITQLSINDRKKNKISHRSTIDLDETASTTMKTRYSRDKRSRAVWRTQTCVSIPQRIILFDWKLLSCSKTSSVHIENRVFSNGFVWPILSSETVRPRPKRSYNFLFVFVKHFFVLPFGYCSVTIRGISRIWQTSINRFDVSMISLKYLIAGRNFSCKSQRKRIGFSIEIEIELWVITSQRLTLFFFSHGEIQFDQQLAIEQYWTRTNLIGQFFCHQTLSRASSVCFYSNRNQIEN